MYKSAAKAINQAFEIESVQSFCEVVMLLLIVASFVIAGVFCLRRVVLRATTTIDEPLVQQQK